MLDIMLQASKGLCTPEGVPYSILVPQSFTWILLNKVQVPNLQILSKKICHFSDQHHRELYRNVTLPINPKLEQFIYKFVLYKSCLRHSSEK